MKPYPRRYPTMVPDQFRVWRYDRRAQWYFTEVSADQVGGPVPQAATAMLAAARRTLRLGPVRIRWFRFKRGIPRRGTDPALLRMRRQGSRIGGFASKQQADTIWIRAGRDPILAATMVAHECRHLWQFRNWPRDSSESLDQMLRKEEADARSFAMATVVWTIYWTIYKPEDR